MHVLLMMTMSFGPFRLHRSRLSKSIVLVWKFVFFFGLFFKCMLARKGFCMQKNKQKKWIPVVANGEKNVIFYDFFNHMLARKGFCMQQNDIAVLRRCQRFFLLGLLFYDDASDFFLRDCNFTTVPDQLFLFFDVKHKFPYW